MGVPSRHVRSFQDHEVVRLLGQYTGKGATLRPGATGTIVYRHPGGTAYEVEFSSPNAMVVTLKEDEITLADG